MSHVDHAITIVLEYLGIKHLELCKIVFGGATGDNTRLWNKHCVLRGGCKRVLSAIE